MTRPRLLTILIMTMAVMALAQPAWAADVQRFPRPELPASYQYPTTAHPTPRVTAMDYADVVLLAVALVAAAYLVFVKRSRRGVFVLMILSLAYFGFWRKGCVCPIGAIQHVTSAVAGAGFVLPAVVLLFFLLPLVFALFFGRVFCSAVCPLGAMQDVVLLRPLKVPLWLERGLGLLPYAYLGLAVLLAATGAGYFICLYDPFVSFFRLSGSAAMLALSGCILLIAIFVGRPYCRFLCPLGVLLKHCARLSWRRVTITPDECIRCRLCEEACPFGAIRKPTEPAARRTEGKIVLALLLVAMPVIVALGGWAGRVSSDTLAGLHPTVLRARDVRHDEATTAEEPAKRTEAFRKTGRTAEQLYEQEAAILSRFKVGGTIFGAYLGLVIGGTLVSLSVRRRRTDYEADRGECLACGRCYAYCPQERQRLKKLREMLS